MSALAEPDDREPDLSPYSTSVALVRDRLGARLRSLVLFGSCLSPSTRQPSSIPDLFAVVDDLQGALRQLRAGWLARRLSPILPPITLSLRAHPSGPPLAKLSLIDSDVAAREISAPRDLYLIGRLSKRTVIVHARDPGCGREVGALLDAAAATVAGLVMLALPRRCALADAIERCVTISYAAEPRPERPEKLQALFRSFGSFYQQRYRPLLLASARDLGIFLDGADFVDTRSEPERSAGANRQARLLRRSRRRMVARWPKQMLVYRGWLVYLLGKLVRARRRPVPELTVGGPPS